MARSLIQTINTTNQAFTGGGTIAPGITLRRFGCNLKLAGQGIQLDGDGYYTVHGIVTVTPEAAGLVTVELQENGQPIPGTQVSTYAATAAQPVSIPLLTTIRKKCCSGISTLTAELVETTGTVNLLSLQVEKK